MITVEEADEIIFEQTADYGTEVIPFELALGRVLAEDIKADRDLPPFNRVTMDGIAVNYNSIENGISTFRIKSVQAAGNQPVEIGEQNECIEIMTGAMVPSSTDTIIRYEDLELRAGLATLTTNEITRGQNIHYQGKDKKQDEVIAGAGELISPALIGILASVGKTDVVVRKMPGIAILSSGDELIEVNETPSPYQIRKSNGYMLQAALKQKGLAADTRHLADDREHIITNVKNCLENYDLLILTGGVSMGKFDYIPQAMEELGVQMLFHKVQQRPGKPFWFGRHQSGVLVFAFPGNPVASFMCLHRYFIPWVQNAIGHKPAVPVFAVLDSRHSFQLPLKYFLQVKLYYNEYCQLMATPVEGNGSGDFANLAEADAFLELPIQKSEFKKGQMFKVWKY